MKKTLALILATAMTLSLASCGDADDESSSKKKKSKSADSSSSQIDSSEDESSSQEETTTTTTAATTETTTTTEETTTTVTEPAKEYSISAIVGDWYIDGDPNTAHLSIHEDGSFESYLASGSLEYEGTVTAGKFDLGDMNGEGEYFCLQKNGDPDFAIYIPYTDAQAVEFTTAGSVSLHFLPKQDSFEMPEGMPFSYSVPLNKSTGIDLRVNTDGSFEGVYMGYGLDDSGKKFEKYSYFVGQFGGLEEQSDGSCTFSIKSIQPVTGGLEKSEAFKDYISDNAVDASDVFRTMGLAEGQQAHLYWQGSKYKDLPRSFVLSVSAGEEKDDMISDTYIWFEDTGFAFRGQ